MSLQNLREDFLYGLLPEGIISLDEQALIQAVVGGYQDRIDDLRAYTSKLELLLTAQGLPETDSLGRPTTNAVIVQVQSPKGKVYSRSLEIHDDTPPDGTPELFAWGTNQLQLSEDHVALSAAYGVDPLRTVEANVLPYLAATVGAVLYQTAAQDPANEDSDARRLLMTWFPRLQFKGTAESFESLGRLLGFDDVRMTPLWTRLSPRIPNDIGDPQNNEDFSETPEFWPKQVRDNFYDPWNLTDGPYYTWQGTATSRFGTNSTDFYTQVVNGFNPFFKVSIIGTAPTDPDPALSPYVMTGGGPETKAFVNPSGTGMKFEAISAGSSFNGLAVQVQSWNQGTHRLLTVTERLSAIKYRSSFYDLALTMDFDHAQEQFGTNVVGQNRDLQVNPTSANFGSEALSPYRPWKGGSFTQDLTVRDWLTETDPASSQTTIEVRTQADLTDRQLNHTGMVAAGIQVVQAMEEVRPATRLPRTVSAGYLIGDDVGYADYCSFGTVFSTVTGVGTYSGTLTGYPYPPYAVQFEITNARAFRKIWTSVPGNQYRIKATTDFINYFWVSPVITASDTLTSFTILTGLPYLFTFIIALSGPPAPVVIWQGFVDVDSTFTHERDPYNPDFIRMASADLNVLGTYNYQNATWMFQFPIGFDTLGNIRVNAHFQPTSTEVVREQPSIWGDPMTVATCGDSGWYNAQQQALTNMIRAWNPDFFFHAGDNSQTTGFPGAVLQHQIYNQDFIDAKKFLCVPGNHDFYNPDSPVDLEPVPPGEVKGYGQTYRVLPTVGPHYVVYNAGTYTANQIFTGINGVPDFLAYGGAYLRRRDEVSNAWDYSFEANLFDYIPGKARYYHVRLGHVELFGVNSGVNSASDPGFINKRKPAEPDGNWCEAPFTPVGVGAEAPGGANPILIPTGGTYTVFTSESYGEQSERLLPSYVVYNSGTYRHGQTFVGVGAAPLAYIYGDPRIDPAPPWAVLRQGRRYRVIGNSGTNWVDYEGKRYYPGDELQANVENDRTVANTNGRVRLDQMNSVQAEQVKDWLRRSQAPWKVVMYHHPNEYLDSWNTGRTAGQYPRTDWPWKEWGADLVISGHVHGYSRAIKNNVTQLVVGFGAGGHTVVWKTTGTNYQSPYIVAKYNYSAINPALAPTDPGAVLMTITPTQLSGVAQTIYGQVVDTFTITKPDCQRAYQERPEDELDDPRMDLSDEYPWRRDLVGGGELVDNNTYNPPTPDLEVVQVGQTVAVFSQTGAQYDVTINKPGPEPPRFEVQERTLTPYVPGQMAIAFTGTFISLDAVDPRQEEDLPRRTLSQGASTGGGQWAVTYGVDHCVDDLDQAMEPGWKLYHFGLVSGVLVADPVKFNGAHHRDGLVAWYPFNEHPRDSLTVLDHSPVGDPLLVQGFAPNDRQFDQQRGWFARITSSGTLTSSAYRPITEDMSLGFWINFQGTASADWEDIITIGQQAFGVQVKYNSGMGENEFRFYGKSALVAKFYQGNFTLYPGWNYVAAAYDRSADYWRLFAKSNPYPFSLIGAGYVYAGPILWDDNAIRVVGNGTNYIQDLRIWNVFKSDEALGLACYHNPTPTACLYRPAYLQAVNDYDRYGIRVLDSGYVTPDLLPSNIDTPTQAWVQRYDSMAQYEAQSRYKETGLGGGPTLPVEQQLGLQWNTMTAAGTAVVSTWKGGFMGMNDAWAFDNPPPQAMQLLQSGSTSFGILPTWFSTGTSVPWPNPLQATNPCRDRIWVEGDDGYIHEVKVARTGAGAFSLATEKLFTTRTDAELRLTGTEGTYAPILQLVEGGGIGGTHYSGVTSMGTILPRQLLVVAGSNVTTDNGAWAITPSGNITGGSVLPSAGTYDIRVSNRPASIKVYHPLKLQYSEQPTGAEVTLTDTTFSKQLRVNTAGQVYAAPYAGTVYAPWLFLYGNEEVNVDYSGLTAFLAWVDKNSFGMGQSPRVAALQDSGIISFDVNSTMLPGYYRLEVTSGNIGKVDDDFDGFRTVVTVGDVSFEATLCRGQHGADFEQTDYFEFYLPHSLAGTPSSWLLTFDWLNGLRDERRGTARQLKISAFKAVRMNTSLYQLRITATGSQLTQVATTGTDFPNTPGGWMAVITSWGTVSSYAHESTLYSGNDTVQSKQPMSNVLTATTVERREDIVLAAPYMISDPPTPPLPVYGPITIT